MNEHKQIISKRAAFKLIWILGESPAKLDVENYLLNGEVKATSK